MEKLAIGLTVGALAAFFEVLLVRTYQKNKIILSAIGSHWLAVGIVMPYIHLNTPIWLKGLIIGIVLTIPFIIYEIQKSKNAVIHTAVFAPIWGIFIAYGTYFLS